MIISNSFNYFQTCQSFHRIDDMIIILSDKIILFDHTQLLIIQVQTYAIYPRNLQVFVNENDQVKPIRSFSISLFSSGTSS